MRGLLLALSLTLASGCTNDKPQQCVSSTGKSVSVRGTSSLRLPPDGVEFAVGIETRGSTVAKAFDTNTRKINAIHAALKELGVADDELQTSGIQISRVYDKNYTGFMVSNFVTVRHKNPGAAGELLQAAVTSGANYSGGLQFYLSDPAATQRQGLELAFQNARSKAEVLATSSGRVLGDVLCVSDGTAAKYDTLDSLRSLGYISGGPTVAPGKESLNFQVAVVFELVEHE